MRCTCGSRLAAWLAEEAKRRAGFRSDRTLVIGLAGHPLTGKTRLAHQIAAAWAPHPAVVLPTEAVIVPRDARRLLGVDGCSPQAHDLDGLAAIVRALRQHSSAAVSVYSWDAGQSTGTVELPGLPPGGLLVVDGSVTCETPIATLCDLLVFLRPWDQANWLREAVARDVRERGWSAEHAEVQNLRKRATVDDQYRRQRDWITDVVTVEPDAPGITWTVRVHGCPACLRQAGEQRAHAAGKAPVADLFYPTRH
jgi:uridine kinase